jgi:hypothetical protein
VTWATTYHSEVHGLSIVGGPLCVRPSASRLLHVRKPTSGSVSSTLRPIACPSESLLLRHSCFTGRHELHFVPAPTDPALNHRECDLGYGYGSMNGRFHSSCQPSSGAHLIQRLMLAKKHSFAGLKGGERGGVKMAPRRPHSRNQQ